MRSRLPVRARTRSGWRSAICRQSLCCDTVTGLLADLNADLGESFGAWRLGDDQSLMQIITSANIACGFHAGDPLTLRKACAMAAQSGVTIGAQVSYRDLAGFGRREMDVPAAELAAELLYQIAALDGI